MMAVEIHQRSLRQLNQLLQILHRVQGLQVHVKQLPGHGHTGDNKEFRLVVQQVFGVAHQRVQIYVSLLGCLDQIKQNLVA